MSRRAHAFAQALDEQSRHPDGSAAGTPAANGAGAGDGGDRATRTGARGDGDSGRATLLALADELRALPRPGLDPEVKSAQRARLIAAMESAFAVGADAGPAGQEAAIPKQRSGRGSHRAPPLSPAGVFSRLRPKSRLGKGLAAGGLGVSVAAGALGSAAVASTDALPGDTLYGLKRGMEDLRLDLTGGDADKGRLYLHNAATRLHEARRLMERGRSGALDEESVGEVRQALSGMRHDAAEGHRLLTAAYERDGRISRMESLSSFADDHRERWRQLREQLPVQLTEVSEKVTSVLDAIEQEVAPRRPLFTAPPQAEETAGVPGADALPHPPGTTPGPSVSGPGSSSSSAPDADERTARREAVASPSPPASGPTGDGLLSGLLGPPAETSEGEAGAPPGGEHSGPADGASGGPAASGTPTPEVTLPPLLPGVLPELGAESERESPGG